MSSPKPHTGYKTALAKVLQEMADRYTANVTDMANTMAIHRIGSFLAIVGGTFRAGNGTYSLQIYLDGQLEPAEYVLDRWKLWLDDREAYTADGWAVPRFTDEWVRHLVADLGEILEVLQLDTLCQGQMLATFVDRDVIWPNPTTTPHDRKTD